MNKCPHLDPEGRCLVALDLGAVYDARAPRPEPRACQKCEECDTPRDLNEVTASLALAAVRREQGAVPAGMLRELTPLLLREAAPEEAGPGTELARLLWWFRDDPDTCRCQSRARLMNLWGPSTCRERRDTILGWLREEAVRRGLPFVRVIAKMWVDTAIRRSQR